MNLESKGGRAIADRLRDLGESEALALAGQFLYDPTTSPIPDHVTTRTTTAGRLLEVWDARVRFAESKGRAFPGAKALVGKLTALNPATELILHYLQNLETVGLFFFEANSDRFVGLVFADRPATSGELTGD